MNTLWIFICISTFIHNQKLIQLGQKCLSRIQTRWGLLPAVSDFMCHQHRFLNNQLSQVLKDKRTWELKMQPLVYYQGGTRFLNSNFDFMEGIRFFPENIHIQQLLTKFFFSQRNCSNFSSIMMKALRLKVIFNAGMWIK